MSTPQLPLQYVSDFIRENPRSSVQDICEHFGLEYWYHERSYSDGAKLVRKKLQQLRYRGVIVSRAQRWVYKEQQV